jgi:hypothetical protein
MLRTLGLASLALAGLVVQASAADDLGGFVDLRLGYATLGTTYSVRYDSVDTDDDWETAHRINLDWVGSLGLSRSGGVLWGIGGTWQHDEGKLPTDEDAVFQYWLVRGQLGYGLPITRSVQLELLPYVGFGTSYLDINDQGEGSDAIWEVGANANLVFTLENGFQVGLQGGMYYYETSIRENLTDERFNFEALSPNVGVFIGARL